MPIYAVEKCNFDISRKALLVDTNVLVKAFSSQEEEQELAMLFLEESDYQLLVPAAVVIETWGMLVGARKNWMGGCNLLAWLNTPGKAVIILPQQGEFLKEQELITKLTQLDCVDAIIGRLAHEISVQCNLSSPLPVATYDAKDYYKLKGYDNSLRINIFDMKEFNLQEL